MFRNQDQGYACVETRNKEQIHRKLMYLYPVLEKYSIIIPLYRAFENYFSRTYDHVSVNQTAFSKAILVLKA